MYKNLLGRAGLTSEFEDGLKTFIEWAKGQRRHMDGDKIRCPCRRCKNIKFGRPDEDYFEAPSVPQVSEEPNPAGHVEDNYPQWGYEQHMDWAQRMVYDAARSSYFASYHKGVPDDSMRSCPVDTGTRSYIYGSCSSYDYDESGLADRFFNVVHVVDQPLWDGCNQSHLGVVAELGRSHRKKSPYVVLRYLSLTPRLKRLYYSKATFEHMTWHATHQKKGGLMCHPSYAYAWKHFDRMYPNFIEEPRNVQLGLCTNGFAPHSQYGRTYSCRSVIITPYNLSPGICTSFKYMFLTMVIPNISNLKRLINVYLEPLIEEMLQLWPVGVRTYDDAMDRAFIMRATLM
ncbi:UNVERIFIED_CONTAM: hypothetical protein Sradi_6535700 [Sesamum radiatum]|uniref:Transposase-associated domain-containing protein n=1 Tax=Sesamum radiatum TaxID=300843 RepID=A0AAW2JVW0_SESRA